MDSRLEYIGNEMYCLTFPIYRDWYANVLCSKRVEENIKGLQQQSEGKRTEVRSLV